MIKYRVSILRRMKHIIAMWCLWVALDIFSHGNFMVYLQVKWVSVVSQHVFGCTQNSEGRQKLWFFPNKVSETSQLLTDMSDVNLTDNQCSIHDKLSLYHALFGKSSKCPFSLCFLLKNGLSTKMSSSDYRLQTVFLQIDVKLVVSKKI